MGILTVSAQFGLPTWLCGKETAFQCRRCCRCRINPWIGKIPWRRKWQPTPVFLPGKSHGQRSLAGYSPWGHKRFWHGLVTKQQHSKDTLPLWSATITEITDSQKKSRCLRLTALFVYNLERLDSRIHWLRHKSNLLPREHFKSQPRISLGSSFSDKQPSHVKPCLHVH